MDAPDDAAPPPPVPAAGSLPAWMRCVACGYDLARLPRGAPCPECGEGTPPSWPVWDLRRCDGAYVRRVLGGAVLLRQAALGIAAASSCGMAALVLSRWPLPGVDELVLVAITIAAAVVIAVWSNVKLAWLGTVLRLDAVTRCAPAAASQHALARDAASANWVFVLVLVLGLCLLCTLFYLGVLIAAVGVPLWLVSIGAVFITGARFLGDAIERAGGTQPSTVASYAIALLPFAGLGFLVLALLGLMPWPWLPIAALLGPALAAGGLARRGTRARRAIEGLLEGAACVRGV
ncbi:MAG: hypothetical protein RIE77_05125 [Phycisphaerales bacterium]|jgi:hypothetical protein